MTARPAEMRTYIPALWGGGDGRRADGLPATAPGNVMRAGRLKSSRGAPYLIPDNGVAQSVPTLEGAPRHRAKSRKKIMTRALKIENLTELDKTSAQILRVISLHLGEDSAAFVDYKLIARSLNIDRDTVRSAVNRMIKNGVLKKKDGKLSIQNAVLVK